MDDLARLLELMRQERPNSGLLIVVDGVFSMEGDIIKLPDLVELAEQYGAQVMVDDAHAIGVLGKTGAGTAEHFDLIDRVGLTTGTFSKSFASLGGFVVGDADVLKYIQHRARALIFSASIPPANAAAVLACLDIIEKEPERREHLWKNALRMQNEFRQLGFNILNTQTPIIPIVVGEDLDAFRFWKELYEEGVFTNPVISPAASYTATHTDEQLDRVVEVMARVGRKRGLIP